MKISAIKVYDTNTQNKCHTRNFGGEFGYNQNIVAIMKRSSFDELSIFRAIKEQISTVKDGLLFYVQKEFYRDVEKSRISSKSYLCKQVGDGENAKKTFIPLPGGNITISEISSKLEELYPELFANESNAELVKSISDKLTRMGNMAPDSFSN